MSATIFTNSSTYSANQTLLPLVVDSGIGTAWHLIFQDEFNGTINSAPDLAKWTYWMQNQTRNNAINRSENTFLDGSGNLVVRVTNSNIGHGVEQSAGGLESVIKTYSPQSYWEARIKSVTRSWFGFWGQTDNGMNGLNPPPDPSDGAEVDILEDFGGTALQHALHYGAYGANHTFQTQAIGFDPTAAYHTYGYFWDLAGGANKYYIDGSLDWTNSNLVSTRTDQMIRLTQEYQTGMPQNGSVLVDYVRIWMPN